MQRQIWINKFVDRNLFNTLLAMKCYQSNATQSSLMANQVGFHSDGKTDIWNLKEFLIAFGIDEQLKRDLPIV